MCIRTPQDAFDEYLQRFNGDEAVKLVNAVVAERVAIELGLIDNLQPLYPDTNQYRVHMPTDE